MRRDDLSSGHFLALPFLGWETWEYIPLQAQLKQMGDDFFSSPSDSLAITTNNALRRTSNRSITQLNDPAFIDVRVGHNREYKEAP